MGSSRLAGRMLLMLSTVCVVSPWLMTGVAAATSEGERHSLSVLTSSSSWEACEVL